MKKIVVLGTLVAVLVGGTLLGTRALAAPWGTGNTAAETVAADDLGFCHGGGGTGPTGTYISPELQRIAKFLGLTPEELRAQLQQGKSLAQVAQSKNITRQALLDTVVAPTKDYIALRVKYGYLTQTQADAILQQELTQANAFIDRITTTTPGAPGQGYGPGYGGMMGGGMMGGGYGGMMGGSGMMGGAGPGGRGMMGGGMMGGYGAGPGWGGMMGGYGW